MARPKLGASESKRLQMVITEDELYAIDTWQHAHRINGRSEAIRRLCQIGLALDQATEPFEDQAALFMRQAEQIFNGRPSAFNGLSRPAQEWVAKILVHGSAMAGKALELNSVVEDLKGGESVEAAMEDAKKTRQEIDRFMQELKDYKP